MNKQQEKDSQECEFMSEHGQDKDCLGCSCSVCIVQIPVTDFEKKCNEQEGLINTQKAIIQHLKDQNEKYKKALLNLADYALTGEYKKETLKLLGLWDEDVEENEVLHE